MSLPHAPSLPVGTDTFQSLASYLYDTATSLFHRGQRYECPCCGGRYRRFKAFAGRPGALCPGCDSLERHRLLWLYLTERTSLTSEPHALLYFAPEPALLRRFHRVPTLDLVSADIESPLAQVRVDITAIPYAEASFDAILCSHVLEHVADDARAMDELYRVLKPGGWAILQVPLDPDRPTTYEDPTIVTPEARARHFGQADHVRVYGRDYGQRLSRAGFTVTVERFADALGPARLRRYGLDPGEDVYLCYKGAAADPPVRAQPRSAAPLR